MFLIVLVLFLALYLYGTRTFNYWKLKNVTHEKPWFLVGNNLKNYILQQNVTQQAEDVYWKYPNEKVVGFYRSWRPELVIRDPDIMKRILIKDFSYFHERGLNLHEKVEPLLRNLFFVDGDVWRLLRVRITPAFTTSKLKAMFPSLLKSMDQMRKRIDSSAINSVSAIDAHDLMARFTIDIVCASLFKVDAATLNGDETQFRKLGQRIFNLDARDLAVLGSKDIFPEVTGSLMSFSKTLEKNFLSLVEKILETRQNSTSSKTQDFMDILIESYKKGSMVSTSIDVTDKDGSPKEIIEPMDKELMAAQAFIFFAAGFETTASVTGFILLQLAYNPLIQKKVHEELDRVFLKYNNTPTYEAYNEMVYLKCVLNEGLRMFPPVGFISRRCTRKYTFPDLNLTIDKGVVLVVPVKAIQNDPKYFKDPSEFRPERFLDDSEIANKYTYIPFGEGPRSCIGNRMGLLQSVMGLAGVLSDFSVETTPETRRDPIVNPTSNLIQIFRDGLPLKFRRRKQ